ncbi:MAG: metalloregulator ArsR/SmtB family transcription factor [Candidatus Thermoplasmatota archaeon]|nr:metalloregulator ArsR/SmtB family transcription factor [Candidatus Thermoplasmatota archaeon]
MKTNNFLKCIVDDNRRNILLFLGRKERCVREIVLTLHLEQSLVSHHLQLLKCCGLVHSRQDGKEIYYRIADPDIFKVLQTIQDLSKKLDVQGECDSSE